MFYLNITLSIKEFSSWFRDIYIVLTFLYEPWQGLQHLEIIFMIEILPLMYWVKLCERR